MQGPAIVAARDLRFRRARGLQRRLAGAGDVGVELRLERVGAREQGTRIFHGRELARPDQGGGLGEREIVERGIGHGEGAYVALGGTV